MKLFNLLAIVVLFTVSSCSSVRVNADYQKNTDFKNFKTFAFYKKGIDKLDLSSLDKKRILKAIESELESKGMVKSTNPDLLVNIFTKSREKIDVYDNRYYGWYPWYYGMNPITISKYTEGTLFIDFIDARKKELVWQGIGAGALATTYKDIDKKEQRIQQFVNKILIQYPPTK